MLDGKRIAVVLPAYQAAATLELTWRNLPHDIVDDVLLVDDASTDDTVALARSLGIATIAHPRNRGYGGNQKTCYTAALATGADVVVMVHPDYQYEPRLVTPMAAMVASGVYDVVLGSRILGGRAHRGRHAGWKYVANRALTAVENLLLGSKLSEFHTGFRASRARCWKRCRSNRTPTTTSSTTRCWSSASSAASGSARSPAPRAISRRRARSASRARSSTAQACCASRCRASCIGSGCRRTDCSAESARVRRAEHRGAALLRLATALWSRRLVRYLVAGSVNTAISQLLYLAGLRAGLTPGVAFACAFAVGIGLGYVLHSRIVFHAAPRQVHALSFPAACLARLAASEWLLYTLIERGVTPGWAGLLVNIAMVPVGYLLTRLALTTATRSRA